MSALKWLRDKALLFAPVAAGALSFVALGDGNMDGWRFGLVMAIICIGHIAVKALFPNHEDWKTIPWVVLLIVTGPALVGAILIGRVFGW